MIERWMSATHRTHFLDRIVAGAVNVRCGEDDLPRISEVVNRYSSLALGFSDAAVVACAESTGRQVLTFDRRDLDVVAREGTIAWSDRRTRRPRGRPTRVFSRRRPTSEDAVSMQEPYRLGSLGDLVELLVDGWEITGLHYSETCGDLAVPEGKAAAFISLMRPDAGAQGLFIPDDERTFSHRALLAVFRESPQVWKYRNPDTIHARLAELATAERPDPESWQDVPDPADVRLDVSPSTLQGVVALGQIESIADVTVALLSLERYTEFSRLRYLAHTDDAVRRGSIAALDVLAVDERGRRYRIASLAVERAGSRLEGVIVLAPGIPRDVVHLTITIGTLGEAGTTGVLGPWVFPIQLPTPSR